MSTSIAKRPLIGVNACSQWLPGKHPFFMLGQQYVQSVAQGAAGMPMDIQALVDYLPI